MSQKRKFTKIQYVYDKKRKVLVGSYLTKKGRALLDLGMITKKEANKKYRKNRYTFTDAKIIKSIKHKQIHSRLS